jgi:hypothetical protein
VGAGRASGDEPEDGTAESIERKPVRVREDITGSHVGSQDDQSAVEDMFGFFSRPYGRVFKWLDRGRSQLLLRFRLFHAGYLT